MKNYKRYCLRFLIFSVLLLSLFVSYSIADVGNHNSYGGSSGSSGRSGGGSRNSSNYSSSDSSSSADSIEKFFIVLGIVFSLLHLFSKSEKEKNPNEKNSNEEKLKDTSVSIKNILSNAIPDNSKEIIETIKQFDPNFNSTSFISWSKDFFVAMQTAWMERNWEKMRPFESDNLFKQHEMQLQEYINNGTINVMKEINVNPTYFYQYNRDKEYEYLTVYMSVSMLDYIIDEDTGKVLKGNSNKYCYMEYLLTFMRKTGVTTDTTHENTSLNSCPNYGAPMQVYKTGKCEYCDFIVKTVNVDWVLSDLTSVNENTKVSNNAVNLNS